MSKTVVIGDVQGCYASLMRLLDKVQLSDADKIIFLGDIINRGPDSVKVMQFIDGHQHAIEMVLGNHDFHFLAVAAGCRELSKGDTLDALLRHEDCARWVDYLRHQPLLLLRQGHAMVHAGIWPEWHLEQAMRYAHEIELALQGPLWRNFLSTLFGNTAGPWNEALSGTTRAQFIVNSFTRMRFINHANELDFHCKQKSSEVIERHPSHPLTPWFQLLDPARTPNNTITTPILFGHWATLGLMHYPARDNYRALCLDSSCVWGGCLSALILPDQILIQEPESPH